MQLILRNDFAGLGKRGDIIEVSAGHARNFLLPKGHAIKATPGAVAQAAKMRSARDQRDSTARAEATQIASTLVPKVITITAAASSEGKLFGSVTSAEIVEAVAEQTGIEIDRKQVDFEPAKTLGDYTATASLHSDVSFPIRIEVVEPVE